MEQSGLGVSLLISLHILLLGFAIIETKHPVMRAVGFLITGLFFSIISLIYIPDTNVFQLRSWYINSLEELLVLTFIVSFMIKEIYHLCMHKDDIAL